MPQAGGRGVKGQKAIERTMTLGIVGVMSAADARKRAKEIHGLTLASLEEKTDRNIGHLFESITKDAGKTSPLFSVGH
jgi:hypothetical protein